MSARSYVWLLLAGLAAGACSKERTGVAVGPPLTAVPNASQAPDVADAQPEAPAHRRSDQVSPVTATFIDLSPAGAPVQFRACEEIAVVVASGNATAFGETLGRGDMVVAQGSGSFDVKGEGLALLVAIRPRVCDAEPSRPLIKNVIRASAAPELVFAGGKMRAHLDAERDVSPFGYIGRLEGTAAVAEHTHPGSWEVLCAIDGAGTVTIDGKETRVGPRSVIAVPPDVPHSWNPDEGTTLVAIQIYSPPGPEQRFKKLAADALAGKSAADGGTDAATKKK